MPSLRTALALTVTAAAASLAAPVGSAEAAPLPVPSAPEAGRAVLPTSGLITALPTQSVTGALASAVAPIRDLKLDPLSNTGVDPLDNGIGSQVADFQPLSTTALTAPVTRGGSLSTLPLLAQATSLLPH